MLEFARGDRHAGVLAHMRLEWSSKNTQVGFGRYICCTTSKEWEENELMVRHNISLCGFVWGSRLLDPHARGGLGSVAPAGANNKLDLVR